MLLEVTDRRISFGHEPVETCLCLFESGIGEQCQQPIDREITRTSRKPDGRCVSAPLIVLRSGAESCAHRIKEDVTKRDQQLDVVFDNNSSEGTLEQVTNVLMSPI